MTATGEPLEIQVGERVGRVAVGPCVLLDEILAFQRQNYSLPADDFRGEVATALSAGAERRSVRSTRSSGKTAATSSRPPSASI